MALCGELVTLCSSGCDDPRDSRDLGHRRQLGCDDFDVRWFDVTLKTSDMSGSDGDTILNKGREANMHCIG